MSTNAPEDVDDLLVIDDVDVGDESELRQVIAEIESLVGVPGRGLRVSVLTTEQWKTVIKRMVPRTLRRGAELYYFMLRDPRDPQHLLVSPSAVRGINEDSRQMYQELVYTTLRCIPTDLTNSLRKGVDDLLAEECGRRIGVDLYVRTFPRQSELVRCLLGVLAADFGHEVLDWTIVFRRTPQRVFLALGKSNFIPYWQEWLKEKDFGEKSAEDLINLLTTEPLDLDDPLLEASEQAMASYMIEEGKKG